MRLLIFTLLIAGFCFGQETQGQEKKTIKPIQHWTGVIKADLKLAKEGSPRPADAPKAGYLTMQEDLEKLWSKWDVKGKAPKVDFAKQIVFVQTASGPNAIGTTYTLDATGNLTSKSEQTLTAGPGFGYGIDLLNREGIKMYNGKPIE